MMFSQEELGEALDYNPETGIFTWKTGRNAGMRAGCRAERGGLTYIVIRFRGYLHYAHRLAVFWMDGYWPEYVDHINGDGTDNRYFDNLRVCSALQNSLGFCRTRRDNTNGGRGIYSDKDGKWWGMVWFFNNRVETDKFNSREEAVVAVTNLRETLRGGAW